MEDAEDNEYGLTLDDASVSMQKKRAVCHWATSHVAVDDDDDDDDDGGGGGGGLRCLIHIFNSDSIMFADNVYMLQ